MKNLKLRLHALSITALIALAGSSFVSAMDADTNAITEEQVDTAALASGAAQDHAQPHERTKKGRKGKKGKKGKKKGAHKEDGEHHHSPEELKKRVAERMEEWQKDPQSLAHQLETAKAADAANATPKPLAEIGMIADDANRRLELFKFQEAAMGKEFSAEDKEAFKKLTLAEVERVKLEGKQVRELLGNMLNDGNYALMTEDEVMAAFKSMFERSGHWHGHHDKAKKAHMPKRKKHGKGGHAEDRKEKKAGKKGKKKAGKKGKKKGNKKNRKHEGNNEQQ